LSNYILTIHMFFLIPTLGLEEANEAANNSCIRITGFCKRLEFLPTDSEARSTTGGQPQPKCTRGITEPGLESGARGRARVREDKKGNSRRAPDSRSTTRSKPIWTGGSLLVAGHPLGSPMRLTVIQVQAKWGRAPGATVDQGSMLARPC
jgi:hypothetical protein